MDLRPLHLDYEESFWDVTPCAVRHSSELSERTVTGQTLQSPLLVTSNPNATRERWLLFVCSRDRQVPNDLRKMSRSGVARAICGQLVRYAPTFPDYFRIQI